MTSVCPKCHEHKRLPKSPYCRKCRNAYQKAWRKAHPGEWLTIQSRSTLNRKKKKLSTIVLKGEPNADPALSQ